jgi:hypothetical protein
MSHNRHYLSTHGGLPLKLSSQVYEHTVAAHSKEPEILVVRNRLKMFPPVGASFTISVGTRSCNTRVIARRCFCAGPDAPHEHYYIDLSELGKLLDWGTFSRVRIRLLTSGRYSLATLK